MAIVKGAKVKSEPQPAPQPEPAPKKETETTKEDAAPAPAAQKTELTNDFAALLNFAATLEAKIKSSILSELPKVQPAAQPGDKARNNNNSKRATGRKS